MSVTEEDVWKVNYFWRDYVTEDIVAYGIGNVWLYHYKENLIGVRNIEIKEAYFVRKEDIPVEDERWSPTIRQITAEHIKECITDVDMPEEKLQYIPMEDLAAKAFHLVTHEITTKIDSLFLGK